jgi:hypothetical protein
MLALLVWSARVPVSAQVPVPAPVTGFVGNQEAKVFHLPTCRLVAKIKPENKVLFANREEAVKAGLTPCRICLK